MPMLLGSGGRMSFICKDPEKQKLAARKTQAG